MRAIRTTVASGSLRGLARAADAFFRDPARDAAFGHDHKPMAPPAVSETPGPRQPKRCRARPDGTGPDRPEALAPTETSQTPITSQRIILGRPFPRRLRMKVVRSAARAAFPHERHTTPSPAGLRTRGREPGSRSIGDASRHPIPLESPSRPTGRRFPDRSIQCHDGGRFHLPLRGSPGLPPEFPLSRPPQSVVADQQLKARYRGRGRCQLGRPR